MNDKTGGPAFPIPNAHPSAEADGMTLLDWFAGQALPNALSEVMDVPFRQKDHPDDIATVTGIAANLAYDMAEAMIAERNKRMGSA